MAKPKYRRVIVKLSGEALSGPEKFGIHQPTIDRFAADLIAAHALGIGLGVVVGGGNVLRGAQISADGLFAALQAKGAAPVTKQDLEILARVEEQQARQRNLASFKYSDDDTMLQAIQRERETLPVR